MRLWYLVHKTAAAFAIGFLGGSVAAALVILTAVICTRIFA